MKAKGQKHLGAVKVKIAIEALQEYETLSELSKKNGLHSNQIFRWKKEFLERAPQIFKMSLPIVLVNRYWTTLYHLIY